MQLIPYTASQYASANKDLLPPGQAWQWPDGGFGDALIQAESIEFERLQNFIDGLVEYAPSIHKPAQSGWHISEYRRLANELLAGITTEMPPVLTEQLASGYYDYDLDDLASFARAGDIGTYVNASGVLVNAAENVRRFAYDPLTLEPKGLLVEGAATNLILRSQDFKFGSWGKIHTLVDANVALAPDGTLSMDGLRAAAVNAAHYLDLNITVGIGVNQITAQSIFVKRGGSKKVNFQTYGVGNNLHSFQFDFDTELMTFSTTTITSFTKEYGFEKINADTWRLFIVGYPDAGTNRRFRLAYSDALGNYTYVGDIVTTMVYVWQAQMEYDTVTSPIYTNGVSVTRNADIAEIYIQTEAPELIVGVSEVMPRKTAAIGSTIGTRLWSSNAPATNFAVPLLQIDHLLGPARIGSKIGQALWSNRSRYVMRVRYYRSVVDPKPLWDLLNAFKQAHVFLWFEDITGAGGHVDYAQN